MKIEYFANIFIHNIRSIKLWCPFYHQIHYHCFNIYNFVWLVSFYFGHTRPNKIIWGIWGHHITFLFCINNFFRNYSFRWQSWYCHILSWQTLYGIFTTVNHSSFDVLVSFSVKNIGNSISLRLFFWCKFWNIHWEEAGSSV